LAGLRIGSNEGYNQGKAFSKAEQEHLFFVDHSLSEEDNFRKLLAGRLDLVIADQDVADYILQRHFKAKRALVVSHSRALIVMQNYLIVSRQHPQGQWIIDTFNRGLAQLQSQGKLRQYAEASRRGEYQLAQ
jgi:polar amino acid transport system substrate-binding protein